jgi:hypothetical protein
MSTALSVDLRTRVLAAVDQGATHRETAARFGVSSQRQPVAGFAARAGGCAARAVGR